MNELALPCISAFVSGFKASMVGLWHDATPWMLTSRAEVIVDEVIADLRSGYRVEANIAVHETATVEIGAILKGPVVIGPESFIAAGAYLRGGCWLAERWRAARPL